MAKRSYLLFDCGDKMRRNHSDGTEQLPEPMTTYHQRCYMAFTWEQIREKNVQELNP